MPTTGLESPPYHSKSHLSHPTFSLNLNTQRVCSQLGWTFSFLVFCGFNLCCKAVMCLQVPGLCMCSPASAAAASLHSLVLQDLSLATPGMVAVSCCQQSNGLAQGTSAALSGLCNLGWIVKICIEKEPFKEKPKCFRKIHFCDIVDPWTWCAIQPSRGWGAHLTVCVTKWTQLLQPFKQGSTPSPTPFLWTLAKLVQRDKSKGNWPLFGRVNALLCCPAVVPGRITHLSLTGSAWPCTDHRISPFSGSHPSLQIRNVKVQVLVQPVEKHGGP